MYTCIYGHAGLVFQRFQIIYKMKLMAAWKIWGFVAIFLAMNGLQPKGSNFFLLFGCFIFSIFTVPALLTVVAIAGVVRCRLFVSFFNASVNSTCAHPLGQPPGICSGSLSRGRGICAPWGRPPGNLIHAVSKPSKALAVKMRALFLRDGGLWEKIWISRLSKWSAKD